MRATNSIERDLLRTAKVQAKLEHRSLGDVLSEFARCGLLPPRRKHKMGSGIATMSRSEEGNPVTSDIVRELRDELP